MSHRHIERVSFAARAARARELADREPAVADLLRFYAALAEYQQQLADSRRRAVDAHWVGRSARNLVAWLPCVAPPGLRASVETMRGVTAEEWRDLFESYRAHPDEAADRFTDAVLFALEAVLQAVAEDLPMPGRSTAGSSRQRCPDCGGLPVVGVLREEGHGARRCLVCGSCFTEWDYLRVVCVKCGEQRFDALPVFSAEQFPHARIDACDTCHSYLKTIDATKDGHAVPVVDDLATVALDLWARDQGYTRVRPSLVRI
jgi:FdhE protein